MTRNMVINSNLKIHSVIRLAVLKVSNSAQNLIWGKFAHRDRRHDTTLLALNGVLNEYSDFIHKNKLVLVPTREKPPTFFSKTAPANKD